MLWCIWLVRSHRYEALRILHVKIWGNRSCNRLKHQHELEREYWEQKGKLEPYGNDVSVPCLWTPCTICIKTTRPFKELKNDIVDYIHVLLYLKVGMPFLSNLGQLIHERFSPCVQYWLLSIGGVELCDGLDLDFPCCLYSFMKKKKHQKNEVFCVHKAIPYSVFVNGWHFDCDSSEEAAFWVFSLKLGLRFYDSAQTWIYRLFLFQVYFQHHIGVPKF